MGSLDPLPAGFEIRFGRLNFQATGNDYLMRITNRDELRARQATGPGPVPVAPAVDASASAQADIAGHSTPQRRQRSGQRSRLARTERRQAARVASQRDAITGETAAAPTGEHTVSGPRFLLVLHGATTAYAASANTDVAVCGGVLAATSRRSGTPVPPPTTSRPTALPASCHPPPHTGTRIETSLACRTQ
jgi:hypothetical protein